MRVDLGKLLGMTRPDDELEPPVRRERAHRPALHAGDALPLGHD
jgi:hypothetical protein